MEKQKLLSGAVLLVLLAVVFSVNSAEGMSGKPKISPSPLDQVYVWYDGDQERKIWLNPGLIAEFTRKGTEQLPEISAYPKTMVPVSKKGGARLWRLDEGVTSEAATRGLKSSHPAGKFSPVFHETSTPGGRKRALPGNIIVYLDPNWGSDAVTQWAAGRNLEIIKKLEIGPNIYVVKTGPGLEALELANTLYKSGEVVAAMPNWWKETSTR